VAPTSCVVFDIDDTLYLERDYVRSGFRATGAWVQEQLGVAGFFERAWNAFLHGDRGTIFNGALSELGLQDTPTLIADLVEVYRAHEPQIELTRDALLCLDQLSGEVHLGVVTDGPAVSQRAKARALGLQRWHPELIITAELGPELGKPHPRAFELIEERTCCSGAACTYVADNPAKDFLAPRQLGWRTIRVRRAEALHHDKASGSDVDVEVGDLSALAGLIKGEAVTSEGNELLC
jgi:putative hydrolase of the HAD superfamily